MTGGLRNNWHDLETMTAAQFNEYATLIDTAVQPDDLNTAVTAAINALVAGAPGALNTLKELADAVNDDASFAASVTTALAARVLSTDPRLSDTRTPTDGTVSTDKIAAAAVTLTKLSSSVQTSLGLADTAVQPAGLTAAINALVAGAPGALDTLNELAAALGGDANFAATVTGLIGAKYTKPGTGIPAADLASVVQTSLGRADTAYQAPAVVAAGATQSAARAAISVSSTSEMNAAIAGSSRYAAPAIDILGDSITAQNGGNFPSSPPSGSTYPGASDYQSRGFLTHALVLLGYRLRSGTNFGIGGQTSSQILARVQDVLASSNPYVHVYAGINDVGQGVALATIQANLLSIYSQLLAAGKVVSTATVGTSLTISGSAVVTGVASGVTSFSASAAATVGDVLTLGSAGNTETVTVSSVSGGGPFTIGVSTATTKSHVAGEPFTNTTKLATLHALNQWIIDYCRGRYVDPSTSAVVVNSGRVPYLADWHSLVADPATGKPYGALQSDGTITTVTTNQLTMVVDGTHPGQDLAHRMGHALAVVLDRIVPPLPIRGGDNSETANLAPNGRCVGSSSGLATGFTLTAASGTITATASKVARTDGVPGEMQQVAIGPGNTGAVQLLVCDVSSLTFTGTDYYTAEVEFETDPNLVSTAGFGVPLKVALATRQGSTPVDLTSVPASSSGTDGCGSIWDDQGILKTKPLLISATANRIQVLVTAWNVDTGTFRVKSVRVRKVPA